MKILGGAYREVCRDPARDDFYGSGLRAAVAISRATVPLELVTAATVEEQDLIQLLATSFGFTVSCQPRPSSVCFTYSTPLHVPQLSPRELPRLQLHATDKTVLAFGMVEADWSIAGTSLIIDPQGLTQLNARTRWSGPRTALVANRSEILSISNAQGSSHAAAQELLARYKLDAVVAKRGAMGAFVVDAAGVCDIGVFPVKPIYPIGTGDVFSSVFACCWGELGLPAAEAARRASLATAVWASRGPLQVLRESGEVVNPDLLEERHVLKAPTIYLAGPFFSVAQRWLVDTLRESLSSLGARVISPLHDVGVGPPSSIAQADLEQLSAADGVLAILDGLDSGTLFEVGYARACGIPVVGFASECCQTDLAMVIGTGVTIHSDLCTAAYHSIWHAQSDSKPATAT